jgi:carboxylesterase
MSATAVIKTCPSLSAYLGVLVRHGVGAVLAPFTGTVARPVAAVAPAAGAKDTTYRIPGGKVGVLLIHGLGGTPVEMRYVANGLARAGYTVHCPQLVGQGGGTMEDFKAATWQDWYRSAERALDELCEVCDTVIVGGLSSGAILSLALAANHKDKVQGLALYAPVLWLNGWLVPWYARLFRMISSKAIANAIDFPDLEPHGIKDPRIRAFIRDAMFSGNSAVAGLPSTPGGAVLEHGLLVKDVMAKLHTIDQPTLIIHPREDDYADLNNAYYLQRALKGRVEMTVLEDSYHIITVDRQRQVVVDQTVAFLAPIAKAVAAKASLAAARLAQAA